MAFLLKPYFCSAIYFVPLDIINPMSYKIIDYKSTSIDISCLQNFHQLNIFLTGIANGTANLFKIYRIEKFYVVLCRKLN